MRHVVILGFIAFAVFLISREWYFWPVVIVLFALDVWYELESRRPN